MGNWKRITASIFKGLRGVGERSLFEKGKEFVWVTYS